MSVTNNVDAAEIDKFQSIASRWWDRAGEFGTLLTAVKAAGPR